MTNIVFADDGQAGYTGSIAGTATVASVGFSSTYYVNSNNQQAKTVLVTVETAAINFTLDGTAPTVAAGTNVGHQVDPGQSYVVRGITNIRNFRCINRVASSGAVVKYTIFY